PCISPLNSLSYSEHTLRNHPMNSAMDTSARDCLVGVVTSDADLEKFSAEHAYRVPARAIGSALSADALEQSKVLALYQTSSIRNGIRSEIELWGEIDEIATRTRR